MGGKQTLTIKLFNQSNRLARIVKKKKKGFNKSRDPAHRAAVATLRYRGFAASDARKVSLQHPANPQEEEQPRGGMVTLGQARETLLLYPAMA